jgi:hypothetical protein
MQFQHGEHLGHVHEALGFATLGCRERNSFVLTVEEVGKSAPDAGWELESMEVAWHWEFKMNCSSHEGDANGQLMGCQFSVAAAPPLQARRADRRLAPGVSPG